MVIVFMIASLQQFNSTTRTPNADITIEMEQKLVDNPVSFLLRLAIGLRHENLNANREDFILEAINLTRNQAASIWDNEIFNSWGEACTLQVMAQILGTDIITISKDSCSVQTFKGSKMRHEPLMLYTTKVTTYLLSQ